MRNGADGTDNGGSINDLAALERNLFFSDRLGALVQQYFDIENLQGMMGSTKWVLLLHPLNKKYASKKWEEWLKEDQEKANKIGKHLWKCMRVTMNLRKKK